MKRKYFLDNIRWTTVLLVIVYHTAYLFNGLGILGRFPSGETIPAFDLFASIVYPWFMVLLFLTAGIAARFSLKKRTGREFLRERVGKILVPSTLGLFVFHWVTGYLNIKMGGGMEYIPVFLRYPIAAISGIGPLWFAQMLFLFSVLLVLFRLFDKKEHILLLGEKTPIVVLFLFGFLIWGASFVGNLPVLTMYRFGIYFVAFLIGYAIFSQERIEEKLARLWLPLTILALFGAVGYGIFVFGKDYTSNMVLQSPITNLYAWLTVLAIFAVFKRFFDKENALTRYFAHSSFAFYVLHYPVMLTVGYLVTTHLALPAICNYLLVLLGGLVGTALLYEVIRRIPFVRFAVLGIRKSR